MQGLNGTDLLRSAIRLRDAGVVTIPVNGKRPTVGTWTACQEPGFSPSDELLSMWYGQTPWTDQALVDWFPNKAKPRDATGLAVVCGYVSNRHFDGVGTLLIDGDRREWLDAFEAKANAQKALAGVAIRQTGSGKRHYISLVDEPGRNMPLARWTDHEDLDKNGQPKVKAGFETRGDHGYFVYEGTHPETGGLYLPLVSDVSELEPISMDQQLTLLEIAHSFDDVQVQQYEAEQERRAEWGEYDGDSTVAMVMTRYNALNGVQMWLAEYDYVRTSQDRWKRPSGKSSSVVVLSNDRGTVTRHYSGNDEMFQTCNLRGEPIHDSFDWLRIKKHGGHFGRALRAAAKEVGVKLYVATAQEDLPVSQRVHDGEITFLDCEGTDIVVMVDSVTAAEALNELGCAAIVGPRSDIWPELWTEKASTYPRRFVWMSPIDGRVERLSSLVDGQLVKSEHSADELWYGRGATELDMATLLRNAKKIGVRMGARAFAGKLK
jgi:hypothetical protein